LTNIASLEDYLNLDPINKARGTKYNFLSNLPENISKEIKNQTFPTLPPNTKPVDAFLLADSNNPNSFIADTTVDPNSIPIDIFFEENIFDVSINEAGVSQVTSGNFSRSQVSTIQNSTSQIGIAESSTTKPSTSQISSSEVGAIQTSFIEKSSTEISSTQVAPFEIRFSQIQPTEVDSSQTGIDNLANIQSVASKIPNSTSIQSENILVLNQWFIDHAFAPNSSVISTQTNTNSPDSFVTDTTIDPNSVPIDIFFEENTFDISSKETSIGQIASNNISSEQTSTIQNSTSQISSYQRSTTKPSTSQISSSKVGTIQTSGIKESSTKISPTQIDPFDVGFSQIQPTEVDSTQVTLNGVTDIQSVASKVSDSSSIESENLFVLNQWFIDHAFAPNSSVVSDTLNSLWNYNLSTSLDIDFQITDLPKGQLAEATITGFDDSGRPNAGTILIDHDANGVGWFIDETPMESSEFGVSSSENYLLAAAESEASGKYDLLTTVLHELSHLYGFIDGYQGYNDRLSTKNGTTKFIGDDFTATLDGEHLDKQAHPYDLLNTHLAPGMRKLPSELDVEILKALATEKSPLNPPKMGDFNPVPPKLGGLGGQLNAKLTSDPLLAIANGDFSIADTTSNTFAWNTRGDSNIENAQAVLTEDSPFQSNFSQTFTVPEAAKTIQFKLIETELGASDLAPPDALEVALLDADTQESLTSETGLTETDSLLNIQPDGTAHFSEQVRIGGATSGDVINLDKSRTVTIDISDLTPGTEATLYFDLLGFGDVDSRVVIDDVRLSDQNLLPPVATDDRATTSQGEAKVIDVLANDSDDDGTIVPESVQIRTGLGTWGFGDLGGATAHGTVRVNQDGTLSYTPGDRLTLNSEHLTEDSINHGTKSPITKFLLECH
jgi:large repetitive protein